jgi:hypothetical protein
VSQQRSRLRGWSGTDAAGTGWKRNRDWFSWHTVTAAVLGIAIPLVIGFFAGALGDLGAGTGIDDSPAGLQAAYPQVWQETYDAAYANAHAHRLVTLVIDQRPDGQVPWAEGVRDGWREGWPDAVDAMREALVDSGVEERSYQWDVLANLERP